MKVHISHPRCSTNLERAEALKEHNLRCSSWTLFICVLKSQLLVSISYREQMQKVFVGLKGRRAAVNGQQVIYVAVQVLQFAQVDLVFVDVVWQGLIQRDQILQVDAQDGHLEAAALIVNPPVVAVVAARGEELSHLAQGLKEEKDIHDKLACQVSHL